MCCIDKFALQKIKMIFFFHRINYETQKLGSPGCIDLSIFILLEGKKMKTAEKDISRKETKKKSSCINLMWISCKSSCVLPNIFTALNQI